MSLTTRLAEIRKRNILIFNTRPKCWGQNLFIPDGSSESENDYESDSESETGMPVANQLHMLPKRSRFVMTLI